MAIPGGNERWENWLQFTQSRLVPKFTPMGFKVRKLYLHLHLLFHNSLFLSYLSLLFHNSLSLLFPTTLPLFQPNSLFPSYLHLLFPSCSNQLDTLSYSLLLLPIQFFTLSHFLSYPLLPNPTTTAVAGCLLLLFSNNTPSHDPPIPLFLLLIHTNNCSAIKNPTHDPPIPPVHHSHPHLTNPFNTPILTTAILTYPTLTFPIRSPLPSSPSQVIKTPAAVAEKLAKAVADGVADWENLRSEGKIDVIYHPDVNEPKFVDLHGVDWEVIRELKGR